MRRITKEIFLNTIFCPTLGWFFRSGKIDEIVPAPTKGQQFRLEEGSEIGRRARDLFPAGVLVAEDSTLAAVDRTRELLKSPEVSTIFEAAFVRAMTNQSS